MGLSISQVSWGAPCGGLLRVILLALDADSGVIVGFDTLDTREVLDAATL
jgi:hypothetical protein